MTHVVVDASVLAAVGFKEPGWDEVLAKLHGCRLHAPTLLAYELASVARKKCRLQAGDRAAIGQALDVMLSRTGLTWHTVPAVDALVVATTLGITAYDASYVWLAGWLGVDLVTHDRRLVEASRRTS